MPTATEQDRAAARRAAMLDTIRDTRSSTGTSPFLSELARAHDVSKTQVRKDLAVLEAAGAIRVHARRAGGIELLDPS